MPDPVPDEPPAGIVLVDDPDDPRVAPFRLNERGLANRLQRRDDGGDGLFMAEGDLVVERALDAGCVPTMALVDGDRVPEVARRLLGRVPVFAGGDEMRRSITQLGMPYSIVALFERPARSTVNELAATCNRLVLAEAVDNPLNVGSIVRNSLGMGWQGLVLDATSVDPLARRAMRVSMGNSLHLPNARTRDMVATVRELVAAGWQVVALTPADDALSLDEVPVGDKVALLVGSERAGLTDQAMAAATHRTCIPMHAGVDSLNVAAATAVACWALRSRRT
jgi:tRNA G18 (ribose-2'-O)-methylase SpoU